MSEETTRRFLTRLWQLQEEASMSNVALSRILGCDPSYVRHLKAGRRGKRIGLNIALRADRYFRDQELRTFLLLDELPVSNTDVPPSTDDEV